MTNDTRTIRSISCILMRDVRLGIVHYRLYHSPSKDGIIYAAEYAFNEVLAKQGIDPTAKDTELSYLTAAEAYLAGEYAANLAILKEIPEGTPFTGIRKTELT